MPVTDQRRILIVEDDPETAEFVAGVATDLGCIPTIMGSYGDGLAAAGLTDFAVIVLDRMLPGGDGIDAIARLRSDGSSALILVLSALGRSSDRTFGLDRGADDYLAKPFDHGELRARLQALLRRDQMTTTDNDLVVFDDLEIRLKARTVHVGQTHVPLSPKEFKLITYFARNAGEMVTRMQLLENVWNLHFDPQTNVVDVHIGRLRRKMETVDEREWIRTSRGEGYIFMPAGPS